MSHQTPESSSSLHNNFQEPEISPMPNQQGCQCRICSRKALNGQHVTCVSEEPLDHTKDPEECNPHSPPPSTTTYVPNNNKNTTGDDIPVTFEPPPKTHTEHPCPRLQQTQRAVVTEQHTNQLHGWAAVEKALTDFDKEEIAAYKEEIDSLLTFAGLYSAVLTAFVIVSYTQLQEDTAAETLQVLRLIANQTTTSTTSTGHLTEFQLSVTAIRINILWFASLIISLAAASLAILVKQWLRAYMAFATASPQGHLRIRQFRREGLQAWGVFAIASMLPVLLQISLSLFFIGLCFFTGDIHPSIGHTALPLICAWASLFITFTIAPCFSARCPYKTPAFSKFFSMFRIYAYEVVSKIMWCTYVGVRSATVALTFASIFIYSLLSCFLHRQSFIVALACACAAAVAAFDSELLLRIFEPKPPLEETDVINYSAKDLEILVAADELQADDSLLGTTLRSALEQSDLDWARVTRFLVRIIGNRILVKPGFIESSLTLGAKVLDISSLSTVAKEAIHSLLYHHVLAKLPADHLERLECTMDITEPVRWIICLWISTYNPTTGFPIPHSLLVFVRCWYAEIQEAWLKVRSEEKSKDQHTALRQASEMMLTMSCVRIIMDTLDEASMSRLLQEQWLVELQQETLPLPGQISVMLKAAETHLTMVEGANRTTGSLNSGVSKLLLVVTNLRRRDEEIIIWLRVHSRSELSRGRWRADWGP